MTENPRVGLGERLVAVCLPPFAYPPILLAYGYLFAAESDSTAAPGSISASHGILAFLAAYFIHGGRCVSRSGSLCPLAVLAWLAAGGLTFLAAFVTAMAISGDWL